MPPRLCCCGSESCVIFADDFNRADNASLGASWTEYAASAFEIFSNQVRADAGGKAICNTVHPTPSGSMAVYVDTVAESEGDVYDLLLNVVDEDNHHLARFVRNDLFDSEIQLYIVSGGVETLLNSAIIGSITGTARTFSAFIADNEFCAQVTFSITSQVTADTTLKALGYKAGIGTTTLDLLMDNFEFAHHLQTKPGCPSCVCQCGDYYVPPCLNIHLEGSGTRMASLNCDFQLRWNRTDAYWEGTANCCGIDWPMILNCGDGLTWESFTLLPLGFDCTVTNGGNVARSPVAGSCNPFSLEFGPYQVTDGDLACLCGGVGFPDTGSWTAVITEC